MSILAAAAATAKPAPSGVFARIEASPGFPEGIVLHGNRVFVAGPASVGAPGTGPSEVAIFHARTGAPLGTIPIAGEDLSAAHGLRGITTDGDGNLYALSSQLGVVRLSRHGNDWAQDVYAGPLPDLPLCSLSKGGEACSPGSKSHAAMPNDIAFDEDGYAYVTDSLQATIFRIPPGGGAPEIWFQSEALAGYFDLVGVNGIRVSPDGARVFFTVSFCAEAPWEGRIFSLPRKDAPAPSDLKVEHVFDGFEGPDGFAFGETGELHVALAGSNQLAVVAVGKGELSRLALPETSAIPLDAPASVAFDGRGGMLVTNQAHTTGNADHFAVLRVRTSDTGAELFQPRIE
ncbi:SMP-30/gluconolactonase/LRE family protein [Polyangium aurulentum]|nr:SMP-30/gluconolactonase/LRE family protein [Polyangium aurulentum]